MLYSFSFSVGYRYFHSRFQEQEKVWRLIWSTEIINPIFACQVQWGMIVRSVIMGLSSMITQKEDQGVTFESFLMRSMTRPTL
ncbi:MAG: hypothetical protein AAF519_10730 [Bacteroidota bacterium]